MRLAKTTKEIEVEELEQLTKPESRATAAFDAAELQGLLDQSRRDDDDLAVPIAPPMRTTEPVLAAASGEITPMASSRATPSAGSSLIPMTIAPEVYDNGGHYSNADAPSPLSPNAPTRVARGSERTPRAHRPLTKPTAPRSIASLLPWIVVALATAAVIALALWR